MQARVQVLSLYRHMLRQATKMTNYNFRAHALRRIGFEFHSNKNLPAQEVDAKVVFARGQLNLLRRQSALSNLYPERDSIMETL